MKRRRKRIEGEHHLDAEWHHGNHLVMPLSHRVVVLDHGEKLTEGPPAEVARDERVITAYLGDRYRARLER